MLLADANGPVVTSPVEMGAIGATGFSTTEATASPYVYSGVLPTQSGGFNWWLLVGALAFIVLIVAILRYFRK
jgi:hypothetical protein